MPKRRLAIICGLFAATLLLAGSSPAQHLSRWALGRPSLLIDLPAAPAGGNVQWADRNPYSIFPNSWAAEGSGVRIEVARVYTRSTPRQLLADTAGKLNIAAPNPQVGNLSGREAFFLSGDSRAIYAIGHDGGVLGGASWVVVATYRDGTGRSLAAKLLDSIKVEREGARHWALRSLGRTFLTAELPFEMTQIPSSSNSGRTRYEVTFDGMDVTVSSENAGEGYVFEVEKTINDMIEAERSRPDIKDFKFARDRYKLGDRNGELLTIDLSRGYRKYRMYKIAFVEKRTGTTATITIDPSRADHQKTTERILRTLRTTSNPIFGWKTYAIGTGGLYIDLPAAPSAPKQQNAVTIYESNSPLAPVEIRELEVGFPGAHSPDMAAKQYFEMQTAMHKDAKYDAPVIEKRLIDGLEARLVKATWKNGQNVNNRQILTIYGYSRQWIVDMLTSKDTVDYMERVMQSVRVKIDFPAAFRRQSFGQLGASFLIGDKPIKTSVSTEGAAFTREEVGMADLGNGTVLATLEMVLKNDPGVITDSEGIYFFKEFLNGLAGALRMKIDHKLRDGFPINIDGIEGRHLIFDLSSDQMKPGAVIQGDFVVLVQGKTLWTAIVLTNYEGGLAARNTRARIINSLRVGI